ncbi:aminotransferase class V-fold PLP-dependent enzyme [Jiangella gansuensis]|uniref:aminotransferase class V-fold PLP-dependent enzyme n=1 Tax=Jiangella gansuensis TaxID=281473 RepID=UPI00047AB910|nr:aminotransferase class V-fold PLP-dependent enzyme [Jiangella gansuensis]
MPRLDAHIHVFERGFGGRYAQRLEADEELRTYDRIRRAHGIDRAVVVGYEGSPEYVGNNAYILRRSREHPWMVPLAYLSVAPAPSIESIKELVERGFLGFSLYLLDSEDAAAFAAWPPEVLRALGQRARLLSLNATPTATSAIAHAVAAVAPCAVLFSHLGLPGQHPIHSGAQARQRLRPLLSLASLPHVGVKVSGLYATQEPPHVYPYHNALLYIEALVERFGTRRLFWGSDFSPALDWVSFDQAAHPTLPPSLTNTEVADIFGSNLAILLANAAPAPPADPASAVDTPQSDPLPATKDDFIGLKDVHYFYTGAEGPPLRAHATAQAAYLRNKAAGEEGRAAHEEVLVACRGHLAALLNGKPDEMALLSNASEALNRTVGAIPWTPGSNVVSSTLEFPSVVQPLLALRKRGVETRIVPHRSWQFDVEDIAAAVDDRTAAIVVSHVSYLSGHRLDLAALASVANDADALLIIDATQSLGVIPVDAMVADIVVASTYKWLLGPHGTGVVHCRDPQRIDLARTGVGWRSVPDLFTPDRFDRYDLWPGTRRFELGYPSFPSLYLLDASLRYLRRYPPEQIEAHVHRLGGRLIDGLAAAGYDVLTPTDTRQRAGTITAAASDGQKLAKALAERGVLAWGGDGRIRFSIHLFNDDADIDAALHHLEELS